MSRRSALKAGFLGALGLSLGDFLRLQASASEPKKDNAVILIWLDGGPSHIESYDPKPDAPAEYRGPFGTIQTKVPGIRLCETVPLHAKHADKMVFVRSLHHDNGDHFAAAHWMLTGRHGSTALNLPQKYPSVGSYVSKCRGANAQGLPAYVGLPAAESVYLFPGYQGAAYLGPQYNPFDVDREQKYLGPNPMRIGRPRCLENFVQTEPRRMKDRIDLLGEMDTLRRDLDRTGTADTLDRYQQQALDMILGSKARVAFDITKEDPRLVDRYGNNAWGQYTLMARRLVEAGVTFCTVDMPHWDDHVNIKESIGKKLHAVDTAVGALMTDLQDRGLLDKVLVVVMGEFGRTPKMNNGLAGISAVPGRDHWGNAISAMMAGGGLRGGQVVGATNDKGEHPVQRALKPGALLATIYHALGIDATQTFKDHAGRPIAILDNVEPIKEIV